MQLKNNIDSLKYETEKFNDNNKIILNIVKKR